MRLMENIDRIYTNDYFYKAQTSKGVSRLLNESRFVGSKSNHMQIFWLFFVCAIVVQLITYYLFKSICYIFLVGSTYPNQKKQARNPL